MSTEQIIKINNILDLMKAALNQKYYHRIMNYLYERAYGDYYMVHFPYYRVAGENLWEGQRNLTEACLEVLPPVEGKKMLEVGCGNGMQSVYIKENHKPELMMGLDLNEENVALANYLRREKKLQGIEFIHSDAQNMVGVEDNSFDFLINVESGFHYPEKQNFFTEIFRVLKPGGAFVIADIVARESKRNFILRRWEKKLHQYYWLLESYLSGLQKAGLSVDLQKDITPPVIEGFMNNKSWFKVGSWKGKRFALTTLWIFARLQISRHKFYLRNHCQYVLLSGKKPATHSA